jgi:pimeloyl-ACP methyl ester carboxylesterase
MKKLYFLNSRKQKLCGILDEPNDKKQEIIIICHGFSSSKYGTTAKTLAQELTKRKMNSFRFDFNGCGESEGKFEEVTVSQYIDDLESAMRFMKERGYKEIILFGGSNGGLVCIATALKHPEIKKLALKSPVPDSVEVWMKKLGEHGLEEWKQKGHTHYFDKNGKKFKVHHAFFEDVKKHIMYDKVNKIKCPVLIIHGDKDITVPLEQSKKLVKNLKNGSLIIIEGANHFFEGDNYTKNINKIFAEWFEGK